MQGSFFMPCFEKYQRPRDLKTEGLRDNKIKIKKVCRVVLGLNQKRLCNELGVHYNNIIGDEKGRR